MGRKKQKTNEAAPVSPQGTTVKPENPESKESRYVVVRDGYRVSSNEYSDPNDQQAIAELEFWKLVEKNHSWGAPVLIVKYDNKLHRVWDYGTER